MPKITRVFIKTGLICFLLSLLFGIVLEIESINTPSLVPLFWHLLMVGWITQIIFGVSLWMFPGRTREEGFTAQKWGWLTYLFLNSGLLLRIVAEPWLNSSEALIWDILIVLSATTQVLAAITYTIEMWPRIQSKKQRLRNRKKKRDS
jgi:hypothetical protein